MTKSLDKFYAKFPCRDHFGELLGYHPVDLFSTPGYAEVELHVEERHLSPSGAVHGGVLSAFADFSMGAALFGLLEEGQLCSTIEFKINYIAPVRLGDRLVGKCKVIYQGRSHSICDAELLVHDRLVAKSLGTYNLYRPRTQNPSS